MAGLLQAHPLLELQGAHRGDRPEVVVESRDAHPELPGDVLDPKRPVEVLAEPLDGPGDAVGVAAEDRDLTEPAALLPLEEPKDDLPGYQRPEKAGLIGGGGLGAAETHHRGPKGRVPRGPRASPP